jgi:hypothetical protein
MESPSELKPFDKDSSEYLGELEAVALADVSGLKEAEKSYGNSWKKRGGANSFFMLCRKFDRIERQVEKFHHDIFTAVLLDTRAEGIIDDIRDLRRYLMLVEAELLARGALLGGHRDNLTW